MLLIKLTAEDLRLIAKTKTDQEKIGIFALIKGRIDQAEILKSMGKEVKPDKERYGWQQALKCAREVIGDVVTIPPYPDPGWYQRINSVLRTHGFSEEYMTKLSEYAKQNLLHKRPTISFDFLVCQHERIMRGEFGSGGKAMVYRGQTPDLTLHKLPEE